MLWTNIYYLNGSSSPFNAQLIQFRIFFFFTQAVKLLDRVISPSQGRYLHIEQYKYRINTHTDISALNGIRTHDPRVRAIEDNPFKSRGYCDRRTNEIC
jgi:hypothetical protein